MATAAERRILDQLCGTAEAAELLQVEARTVTRWRQRGIAPAPDKELAHGVVWLGSTLERWAKATGRWPHAD